MTASDKLSGVLPALAGKTIARTMVVFHQDGGHQLWLFFTDGTSYEFYGRGDLNGARHPDYTTVERVFRSVQPTGAKVVLAPDRRAVER